MSTPLTPEDERLLARLKQHPQLRGRVERLVDLVEDAGDDLRKADEAERRVIEEVRGLGQELLEDWAVSQRTAQGIGDGEGIGNPTARAADVGRTLMS